MIFICGTHVQIDNSSSCFFHFFKILIFQVVMGEEGSKVVMGEEGSKRAKNGLKSVPNPEYI